MPSLALRSPASVATRDVWTATDVQSAASKSPSAASAVEASPRRAAPAVVESMPSGVAQADVHPKSHVSESSGHSRASKQLSLAPETEDVVLVENDATTATGNKQAVPAHWEAYLFFLAFLLSRIFGSRPEGVVRY